MIINWNYVKATGSETRWDEAMGTNVGRVEWLLQAGMHYEAVELLRQIGTKARLVSDYLDEVEKRVSDGMVPGSGQEAD